MKHLFVLMLGFSLLMVCQSCRVHKVAAVIGPTGYIENSSFGFNVSVNYLTEVTEHLEGSVEAGYQAGFGNGANYFTVRPAMVYHFDVSEGIHNGFFAGGYTQLGVSSNLNFIGLGGTVGYRIPLKEKIFLDASTDQGFGVQRFKVGVNNNVYHSSYRLSVGYRF